MNNKPMAKDITGERFGKLVVIQRLHKDKHNRAIWECVCDCGKVCHKVGVHLNNGEAKSCGCYKLEKATKHGMADTPLHNIWKGMNSRCNTPSSKNYKSYGGRGIKICPEWEDFINFFNDMKDGYRKGLSLERKKVNEGYSKDNCRWATSKEQSRNKTNSFYIDLNGEIKTLSEWEEISGTHRTNIQFRLKRGWDTREAIFGKPVTELSEISQYLVF